MVQSFGRRVFEAGLAPANPSPHGASPLGAPADIANAILFLASDESRFINGQRLVVDNSMSVTAGYVPAARP